MIELAKHIEVLLLENDCVIVPGLGGFIAHNRPASVMSGSNELFPPVRIIGFNPQLVMNDGLLVQSYMQAYNTDFPDATRKIEKVVEILKDELYQQGHIQLNHIGTIYYNMNGVYEFEPEHNACFTPRLYGLEKFSFPLLAEQVVDRTVKTVREVPAFVPRERRRMIHSGWIRNAVTAAAAILLFFILSIPVGNTYVDEANYASLGDAGMFETIRNQSAIMPSASSERPQNQAKKVRNNINTLKPVAVRTEKVAAASHPAQPSKGAVNEKEVVKKDVVVKEKVKESSAPVTVQPKADKKGAYIIVASLTNAKDADRELKSFEKQGYKDVQVLESEERYRIALQYYSNTNEAYRKVAELRKDEQFKNAWIFINR